MGCFELVFFGWESADEFTFIVGGDGAVFEESTRCGWANLYGYSDDGLHRTRFRFDDRSNVQVQATFT